MTLRLLFMLVMLSICACLGTAEAQVQKAKPGGPLVCHKEVCPLPTSSCQTLESDKCVRGRCPAIINVPDGTSCSDGSICTNGDACQAGVCGGSPVVCSSPTDSCTETSGCATACGAGGCVVAAAGGYLSPTLTIPPGALSAPVAITMNDQGSDPNDTTVFHVYSFGPSGTTFSPPATVDLPAPPLGANQSAVIEVSDDRVNWVAVPTTLANGRVSGPIAHFSWCRTRAITNANVNAKLIVTDMVSYQDVVSGLVIPPPGEQGSCYSGDLYGLCFKLKNLSSSPITSTCGTPPTPTNPPPPGCLQFHVVPWQCYTALRNFPAPFDPANPTAYEGQHCDITGLLIPCGDSAYNLDTFLPPGGLPGNSEMWVDLNFFLNPPLPANNTFPYSCFGSSFVGVDLVLREPSPTDTQGGIRSAMQGPFIDAPAGTNGCSPVPPATSCKLTWENLTMPNPANYPTLRFNPSGAAVKNWLLDGRF